MPPPTGFRIVILGGGTAGWMAANLFAQAWPSAQVTVIESPEIGIIGVGEGSTPQLKAFFDTLGIAEAQWMPACNATDKNGIVFRGWSDRAGYDRYFHPFPSSLDLHTAPAFFDATLRRRHGQDVWAHPSRFFCPRASRRSAWHRLRLKRFRWGQRMAIISTRSWSACFCAIMRSRTVSCISDGGSSRLPIPLLDRPRQVRVRQIWPRSTISCAVPRRAQFRRSPRGTCRLGLSLRMCEGVAMDPHTTSALTVWHDGACPLCRREIAWLRRLDRAGAIHFVDVAVADGAVCPIDRDALLARFHARENGVLLSGAAAFAAMWRAIPVLRPLGLAARVPIVLAGLERLYRLFLHVRPMLQRTMRKWDAA